MPMPRRGITRSCPAVAEGIEPGKKPSELSSQTGRKEFIERIAHIVLNGGELIEEPPF